MKAEMQPILQPVSHTFKSILRSFSYECAAAPVNLIHAFHTSLTQITRSQPSIHDRIQLHHEASQKIKKAATDLGLKQVAIDPACAANGMTAVSRRFNRSEKPRPTSPPCSSIFRKGLWQAKYSPGYWTKESLSLGDSTKILKVHSLYFRTFVH